MADIRNKSEEIRRFIISQVQEHPGDIAKRVVRRFDISRQAANRHLLRLVNDQVLASRGATRNKQYHLRTLNQWQKDYEINASLTEAEVWIRDISPLLARLPGNALDIWHYGFTEMFNNAIDHSGGDQIQVMFEENAATAGIVIMDNGVGIFKKIQATAGLFDERHAPLELAKGKFTTDPENHSGEGIFFASRMFDEFIITSGDIRFSRVFGRQEYRIHKVERPEFDTVVWMRLKKIASRTAQKIFNQFTSGDDSGFTKTNIPVRLAQYGDDKLISRSQAKRLLVRVDRFNTVIFDFSDVESIGQAFADEIFRVFARRHPEIELNEIKANTQVKQMIQRARSAT